MEKKVFLILSLIFSYPCFAGPCDADLFGTGSSDHTDLREVGKQLKRKLQSLSPKKTHIIDNMEVAVCGLNCLSLSSDTHLEFRIQVNENLSEHKILLPSLFLVKELQVPSWNYILNDSTNDLLRAWLVGHEVHPYTQNGEDFDDKEYSPEQMASVEAFKTTLSQGTNSFLLVAPTSFGKTFVLVSALREKLFGQNGKKAKKISFVTVDQIKLVDQLYDSIQAEFKDEEISIINWNTTVRGESFSEAVEEVLSGSKHSVFTITSQALKIHLMALKEDNPKLYKRLSQELDGVYIDEVHHLGANQTKEILGDLRESSGFFLYGGTATPNHYKVNLRSMFETEYWPYLMDILSEEDASSIQGINLEKILDQLSLAMQKGDITPFDEIHAMGESEDFVLRTEEGKEIPLFQKVWEIKNEELPGKEVVPGLSHNYDILNPKYYPLLAEVLQPIFSSNKKGFIITTTIAEAIRLKDFFSKRFENKEITFELYYSLMPKEAREEVLSNSKEIESHYIVAVRSLDEGVNIPWWSAYIDLNKSISMKRMIQRIGRVLRLYPGKPRADIFLLSDYRDEGMAKELLSLLELIEEISTKLGFFNSDEEEREEGLGDQAQRTRMRSYDYGLTAIGAQLTRVNLRDLRKSLEEAVQKFWNSRKEFLDMDAAIDLLRQREDIQSKRDFQQKRPQDKELQQIPLKPNRHYPNWPGWPIVLGKPERGKKEYLNMDVAIAFLRERKDIQSKRDFQQKRPRDRELQKIPSRPGRYYKNWPGWPAVLEKMERRKGTKTEFLDLDSAIAFLREREDIQGVKDFQQKRPRDRELRQIPANPEKYYPNWPGWPAVLEKKERERNKKFLDMNSAIDLLGQREDIQSIRDFSQKRPKDKELQKIPSNPGQYYPNWPGWPAVLKKQKEEKMEKGKNRKEFLDMDSAIALLREREDIQSGSDFNRKRPKDRELQKIPSNPGQYYPNWPGWRPIFQK